MPRHLARVITEAGGSVVQQAEFSQLVIGEGRVRAVRFIKDGAEHEVECDHCISTIPLPWLVHAAKPQPPAEITEAAAKIRYKPIAIYGLLVKKPKCIDALYIYYRDRAFHRVGEPKNAGLQVTPADHSVLIVETTCEVGDEKWQGTEEVRQRIFSDLEIENICHKEEVVEVNLLHCETGYPVFALGFEPHLEKVRDWIESIPNLQSVGRQGGFTYPNMHSAMRMGAKAAQVVLDRLKPNHKTQA
jgi:protoporphyrinogen oxidase